MNAGGLSWPRWLLRIAHRGLQKFPAIYEACIGAAFFVWLGYGIIGSAIRCLPPAKGALMRKLKTAIVEARLTLAFLLLVLAAWAAPKHDPEGRALVATLKPLFDPAPAPAHWAGDPPPFTG